MTIDIMFYNEQGGSEGVIGGKCTKETFDKMMTILYESYGAVWNEPSTGAPEPLACVEDLADYTA